MKQTTSRRRTEQMPFDILREAQRPNALKTSARAEKTYMMTIYIENFNSIINCMKRHTKLLMIVWTLGLFACNPLADKPKEKEQHFDCNSLTDPKVIYKIAQSIIDKHKNDQMWNLSEMDTTNFFTTEDYFTNPATKNRLVLLAGNAGMSSGNANNLLILFSCADTVNIVWSGQIGDFKPSDIKDVNGDGIKEIVCSSGMTWMGECNENYDIFTFKDSKKNVLFTAHSTSVIDCGFDNLTERYKKGDTLENKFECSLINLHDKAYQVKQIHTIKIHNGGKTDPEMLQNIKVTKDTTIIQLQ